MADEEDISAVRTTEREKRNESRNIVVAEEANKKEELTPEKVNCIEEYSNEGQNLVDVSEEHDTVKETVLEISTPNEESAIVVDIYQDIEADDVTKECVEKGEDELNEIQETDADSNETRDHTVKIEDMTDRKYFLLTDIGKKEHITVFLLVVPKMIEFLGLNLKINLHNTKKC